MKSYSDRMGETSFQIKYGTAMKNDFIPFPSALNYIQITDASVLINRFFSERIIHLNQTYSQQIP
jgi:hypothetical protein